ncbi:nucleoid occlusion protein [Lactiplantibacillus mudanjiangensis]|uniref:Chromosome partitioning protein, DNA-binding protein [Lactobacillus plantarum JDM1] n=1 Tax=Lactiplantibacillus mudanjiangensis TaxID=1296538 RepID=A0A660DW12_9LACO|nr:nucleoid occlusion protein [Lactiplantibacillus mudanjiangensis]VDG20312.1 chromosome partitioning protein, DNA-binding protein [Lactobacillus plantarum JDM1] [Lactiplantibacillus mudanjiangensis]VDG23995.1 chromosome partitioning protein, DNA-binding protein [Lactobacillus plantarum JDM1] [Lactiplantibacillus mudanjiangensis]VDG27224.1 chromosome partitioning protein, DNA-binding protein [Lactobacillus plantarum JDM1] [Lactiplantibacillus mudanjiangensis]VDG33916.1 chromosome partitioning p
MAFSLFGSKRDKDTAATQNQQQIVRVPVTAIIPNRFQPRQIFDETGIAELAATIAEHGLLQPIVLREYEPKKYEIIAGERRFRAITSLHWADAPAIIQKMDDSETASMALIENLQRQDLTVIEEATAYQDLMQLNQLTQAALASELGKSQSFVANKLRLLKLAKPVQQALLQRQISERHGRALLTLTAEQQQAVLTKIIDQALTVKETEQLVQKLVTPPKPKKKRPRGLTGDTRIAVNTIKQSIKMVTDTGLSVKTQEEDTGDGYRITIEIPKNKPRGGK